MSENKSRGPRRKTLSVGALRGAGVAAPKTEVRISEPLIHLGEKDLHLTDLETAAQLRFKADELVAAVLEHVHPGAVLVTDLPEVMGHPEVDRYVVEELTYSSSMDPDELEMGARRMIAVARQIRADRAVRKAQHEAEVAEATRRLEEQRAADTELAKALTPSWGELTEKAQSDAVDQAGRLRRAFATVGGLPNAKTRVKSIDATKIPS